MINVEDHAAHTYMSDGKRNNVLLKFEVYVLLKYLGEPRRSKMPSVAEGDFRRHLFVTNRLR